MLDASTCSLEDIVGTTVCVETQPDFGWRGEAYVRVADGWVSIPGALPREQIRIAVAKEIGRGRRAFATLIDVVKPSPRRVNPHCPVTNVCRGCQLRHSAPETERDFKATRISELLDKFAPGHRPTEMSLEHIGPIVSRAEGYRWRANLTYSSDGVPKLGLVTGAQRSLISMEHCASLTPDCRRLVGEVMSVFDALEPPWPDDSGGLAHVEVWASEPASVRLHPRSRSTKTSEVFTPLLRRLQSRLPSARVVLAGDDDELLNLPYRAGEYALVASPGAWVHATVEPAEALYSWLNEWLGEFDGAHFDAGCGIGAIALLAAAAGREAVGIDRSLDATRSAAANAERHGFSAEFVTGDWEKVARDMVLAGRRFETATLNPMREPMGERTLAYVDRLVSTEVRLLGPSPEAASREVAVLGELGWHLERVWSVDLHPASFQVMMAASLRRVGG
jgi:tRNA/tmRNA/rRNA uracil-C5-methylase (TrmA/RlmC/RlmD family)